MDTKVTKRTYPPISEESLMLANQARREFTETGAVTTTCPKCGTHPLTRMVGNRTIVSCECGYVLSMEINF